MQGRRVWTTGDDPSSPAIRLPLDAAADARLLFGGRRAPGGDGFDRRPQITAGHGLAVRRTTVVELAVVGELARRVEDVEIGRARRTERARDVLALVEQKRKTPALVLREPRHRGGRVLWVRALVVRVDGDGGEPAVHRVVHR